MYTLRSPTILAGFLVVAFTAAVVHSSGPRGAVSNPELNMTTVKKKLAYLILFKMLYFLTLRITLAILAMIFAHYRYF